MSSGIGGVRMGGILGVVLGACAVPTPGEDYVSRAEVDEMIEQAVAGQSGLTDDEIEAIVDARVADALLLADCLPRSEAENEYATVGEVLALEGELSSFG